MADETTEQSAPESVLGMSDEAMASFDPSTLVSAETQETSETEDKSVDEPATTEASSSDEKDIDPENPDDDDDADTTGETVEPKPTAEQVGEGEKVEAKESQGVDFEAEYKKLLAPFKANGRDIQVKSVDDAVALMQMGANYNKKMAALKPNLKLMKLLENNGLLSEEKLSFLIDLDKKSPEAINKLVKDSGIDPMDLNAEKASEYKANTYTVDDREIELDTVLEDIQDSPTYNRTLEIVSNKWDSASKQIIGKTPQILKVINSHVETGIYDVIIKEVESERVFGRLDGLSDIEAYRQVGDAIHARGGFSHLTSKGNETPTKPVVVTPKPKVDDEKLRDKKRAASSTKPAAPSMQAKDFNPLAMSDDEFSKIVNSKFL